MTYQGARARPVETEAQRVFEVSVIRLDPHGWPSDVLWAGVVSVMPPDLEAKQRQAA